MNTPHPIPRRAFLAGATTGSALLFTGLSPRAAVDAPWPRFPVIFFTKALQHLSYEENADIAAEAGWDGVECPVRSGGQVLPERVEDDLPRLVAALRKRGKRLALMTTNIVGPDDPQAERILRTGSKLGIRLYRLGPMRYRRDRPIPDQLATIRSRLKDLAALNRELGMCAGFQNHSGADYVGAPVWDIHEVIRDLEPTHQGVCFDIGHATVEGGLAWPTHAQLMEPYYCCVFVKDFTWQRTGRGWSVQWGPLGEGMVQRRFFDWLRTTSFRGPVSLHVEYPAGTGAALVTQLKRDTAVLKEWIAG